MKAMLAIMPKLGDEKPMLKKAPKAEEPDADDEGVSEEEQSAASDMLSAAKAGDAETYAVALKNFIRACMPGY